MKSETIEIQVEGGIARVWESSAGNWSWAHPKGSQGGGEPDCQAAIFAVETLCDKDRNGSMSMCADLGID